MNPHISYKEADFDRIEQETGRALRAFAARLLGRASDANDAVQEAFVRFARKLAGPPPGKVDNPSSYLYAATRNICFDMRRENAKFCEIDPELLESGALRESPQASSPAELLEKKERRAIAAEAFNILSERERELLSLKMEHGKSYREISEITGLGVSHVGVAIHHAVLKMRDFCIEKGRISV